MKGAAISVVGILGLGGLACGEGGLLAVSVGAPVTAVVEGVVTECGAPVPEAEVVLLVQQARPGQARPVDSRTGPVTTDRQGEYVVEVGPAFAVPGPASVRLRVTPPGGPTLELPGGVLELSLGSPARDTTRLDADLDPGLAPGGCTDIREL
jgi:hypothetical protein